MTILYNLRHNVGVMRDEITKNVFSVLDQIAMEHFNYVKPNKLPFLPPSLGTYTFIKNIFVPMGNIVSMRDRKLSMMNIIEKLSIKIKYLMRMRHYDSINL